MRDPPAQIKRKMPQTDLINWRKLVLHPLTALARQPLLQQRRAARFIPIGHLTLEAVVAFIGVDLAGAANCPALTLEGANLAWTTALLTSLQPVEETQSCWNGQRRAQGTKVTAKKLPDK